MTTEQSIAVDYFIELMEKHRVQALVIQKGEHIYGVVKAKHEALEVPFNADRDHKYFSRLAQQLQDDLDQFFGFSKLGDEEVLWKGNY